MDIKRLLSFKKIIGYIFIILLITAVIFFIINKQKKVAEEPVPLTKVRYASVPAIVEAPAHIAYDKGFFEEEGIALVLEMNPDGKTSMEHLFEGTADIIATAGIPIIYSSMVRDDFYIIGKYIHKKLHWGVARRDRGIESIQDLKGKKIAVTIGTSGHFYLDSLLLFSGLGPSDINLVNLNAPDSVKAIEDGAVDALVSWFPFTDIAKKSLDSNSYVFSNDNIVSGTWLIIATKEYVHTNPKIIEGFINALVKADEYLYKEPLLSKNIYSKISGVDISFVEGVFPFMDFNLSLDQSLLMQLEEQARWMISYGYTDRKSVPNYLDYIYTAALESVNPGAVDIITRTNNDN